MYKYKAKNDVQFRCGVSVEEPWTKKVYDLRKGQSVDLPLKVNHPDLELITDEIGVPETGEMRPKKQKAKKATKESE